MNRTFKSLKKNTFKETLLCLNSFQWSSLGNKAIDRSHCAPGFESFSMPRFSALFIRFFQFILFFFQYLRDRQVRGCRSSVIILCRNISRAVFWHGKHYQRGFCSRSLLRKSEKIYIIEKKTLPWIKTYTRIWKKISNYKRKILVRVNTSIIRFRNETSSIFLYY